MLDKGLERIETGEGFYKYKSYKSGLIATFFIKIKEKLIII